jgi:hypothetical protein
VFALLLYRSTAQSIARAYAVELAKPGPIELAEGTALLWAYNWTEVDRPGGEWLLLTKSREDAARVLGTTRSAAKAQPSRGDNASRPPLACVTACDPTTGDPVVQIWEAIQKTLDEMARYADAPENGLRCYLYTHRKLFPGSFPTDRWEDAIVAGLARGLSEKGIATEAFVHYPESQESSDLVVRLSNGGTLWIECRTAYRMDLGKNLEGTAPKECRGNRSWVCGVADIAAKDILKLERLTAAYGEYICILLLGFDRDRRSERIETHDLCSLLPTQLRDGSWIPAHGKDRPDGLCYPDRYSARANNGYRDRVWFWYRRVTK